jgi:hypothetical protein
MPLLAYFSVVGSVLVGLLYVAEARLGPPKALSITTNFHGLPAPWKAAASVPILTVRDGLAPEVSKTDVGHTAMAAAIPPPAVTKTAVAKKARKTQQAARHDANRNRYAHGAWPTRGVNLVASRPDSAVAW